MVGEGVFDVYFVQLVGLVVIGMGIGYVWFLGRMGDVELCLGWRLVGEEVVRRLLGYYLYFESIGNLYDLKYDCLCWW